MNSNRKRKSILKEMYYGISPVDKGPLRNPDLLAAMNAVADGEDRFIDGFKLAMRLSCESLADSG